MLLLAIDTSTPTVTAAVVVLRPDQSVELVSERTVTDPFKHAETLMPLVTAALHDSDHRLADLDAIVVGLGPGPFTGLRVGIATAQALGFALGIPVHGVGSHDACAQAHLAAHPRAGEFMVVTDARRREVYLSAYSEQGRRLFGPAPVAPAAASTVLADAGIRPVAMIGAGTWLLAGWSAGAPETGTDVHLGTGSVLAAAPALLAGVVPGPLTPWYLRRPDATEPGARKSVLGG